MSMSAFGVEDPRISKADKKKTEYTGAALGGYAAGGQIGARIGARTAGTRYKAVRDEQKGISQRSTAVLQERARRGEKIPGSPREAIDYAKPYLKEMAAVPGTKAMWRGGVGGAAAGLAAGVGGLALARHHNRQGQGA